MMANDYSRFNAEPIMLCHSSSLATADDKLMMDTYESQHYSSDDDEPVVVKQNLDPEQKNYEFPPRARLRELSYLDDDDIDSFFDESSFSTSESDYCQHFRRTASSASDADDDVSDDDDHQMLLVDDSRLSPLQLPARASCSPRRRRARELSCDSTATVTQIPHHPTDPVGPSSFLKQQPSCNHLEDLGFPKNRVTQSGRRVSPCHGIRRQILSRLDSEDELDLPVFRNEAEPIMDDMSDNDSDIQCDSKIVLIKLNTKHKMKKPLDTRHCCSSTSSYHISDEGYEEDYDDEPPIESVSVFLPLSDEEQEHMLDRDILRNAAATRIQAAWRGYRSRKKQNTALKPAQRVVVDLARICSSMHGRQMARMNRRMEALEQRIREEQAMRMAFEKAMEDMTILIDQQQKMLSDRIDEEIAMRESYEHKMAQVESKLKKEAKARNDLERSMSQVLVQVQDMQQAQQRQAKEDADAKKTMRRKLDETQQEIALIRRQQHQQPPSMRSKTPAAASTAKASSTSSSSTASSSTTKASSASVRRPTTTTTSRRTIVPSTRPSSQATPTPQPRAASRMDSSRRPTAVPRTASQQQQQRQQSTVTRRATLQRR